MKMNKVLFSKILACLLILIGISCFGFVLYTKYKTNEESTILIDEFKEEKESSTSNINNKKKIEVSPNIEITNSEDNPVEKEEKSTATNKNKKENKNQKYLLKIDKIGLEVPILEGTSDDILAKAVGHFNGTAKPGDYGNCAIAGHRNLTYSHPFEKLNLLGVGDKIQIESLDKIYTYRVVGSKVVKPTEVSVLNQISNKKEITLVTCTYGAKERLIIKGELK